MGEDNHTLDYLVEYRQEVAANFEKVTSRVFAQDYADMLKSAVRQSSLILVFCDYLSWQAVLMAGMVRDATAAVIVYMTLHVITSLASVPVMQDGKGSRATNVSF